MTRTINSHDFDVSLRPLFFKDNDGNFFESSKYAIVRNDNMNELGTVSNRYCPLLHTEATEIVEEELNKLTNVGAYEVNTALNKTGAIMHRSYTFKDVQREVSKGDIVGMRLRIVNGIDGLHGFSAFMDGLRLVCTNGMTTTKEFYSVSLRHYTSGMDHHAIQEFSRNMFDSFDKLMVTYKDWANEKINDRRAQLILQLLPKRMAKKSLLAFPSNTDGSKWGLYNTMTYVNSHESNSKSASAEFIRINNGMKITSLMNSKTYFDMDIPVLQAIVDKKNKKDEEMENVDFE